MSLRLTRRHWVMFVGAAPLLAQNPPAVAAPEERTVKAKNDVHEVSDKLAAITVPMDVEPSFRFVA